MGTTTWEQLRLDDSLTLRVPGLVSADELWMRDRPMVLTVIDGGGEGDGQCAGQLRLIDMEDE